MTTLASSAKTIAVNAAFLQEVKDSNLQLWDLLHRLRMLTKIQHPSSEMVHDFVALLGELRDCIALEFSLEETYGYIENAMLVTRFGGDANEAKLQHRELYLQIRDLCECVEEAQYTGTIVRDLAAFFRAFDTFDTEFKEHEELEARLIHMGLGTTVILD